MADRTATARATGALDPLDGAARSLLAKLPPGSVIDGKYRIDSFLGRGAMGVVTRATNLATQERVALKFLLVIGSGARARMRFRREARICARLRNEHVTRVLDAGEWEGHLPYMVMELVVGDDLKAISRVRGPLPVRTTVDWMVQVCEGLAEAHACGVVHRDLKPSNLVVTLNASGAEHLKILDFGVSKLTDDEGTDITETGVILGSPKYAAPEQLFASSAITPRADVWSLGVISFELLCGRTPWDHRSLPKLCAELASDKPPPSLRELGASVPSALEATLRRCLERDPLDREEDVATLAGDLLAAVGDPRALETRARIEAVLEGAPPQSLVR